MNDDFVKRGAPTGMSLFAKIAIAIVVVMVLGGLFLGYQMNTAYAEITEAVDKT